MGQALYRKYRSRSLSEIIGQEHITKTLDQALQSGRISHAYLFTGPRGTGKTSIARILAHEINKLPYSSDSAHLDIIEIDAASNRRIDEIRDLRDKVHIAPAIAKYKIYIIDEVHMLTREAFNALLKTLEEPPEHVVFILATTEVHKLPETIISRTQRFTFKPVELTKVIAHLRTIADQEKIQISDEALGYLAAAGEGSFRDSISLLDQAGSSAGAISLQDVQNLLGLVPQKQIQSLAQLLAQKTSSSQLLEAIHKLYQAGYQAPQLASQLVYYIRQTLLDDQPVLALTTSLDIIDKLIRVPTSYDPARYLEIVLLEHATAADAMQVQAPAIQTPVQASVPAPKAESSVAPAQPPVDIVASQTVSAAATNKASAKPSSKSVALNAAVWPEVLKAVKAQYYTLYSVLKTAEPVFADDHLELQFDFAFHQKRIHEVKNRKVIADIIFALTGKNSEIICTKRTVDNGKSPLSATQPATTNSITDIFGGGELIES